MKKGIKPFYILTLTILFLSSCNNKSTKEGKVDGYSSATQTNTLNYPQETNFAYLKQLTNGGDNAEAYWSFNNEMLVFQSNAKKWDLNCDQIFYFNPEKDTITDNNQPKMLSTGLGRTTCSYFMQGDTTIVYASTHLSSESCPPEPERSEGSYVWPIYDSFEIFEANLQGEIIRQLTDSPGYDAEATVSPDGEWIVFTSIRTGDLELFVMRKDGTELKQITNEIGYDGGAFFSPDGKKLVYRASRPTTEEAKKEYFDLLAQGLVKPTEMEIYVCDVDGNNKKQVTNLGKANWCPFFHPSGEKIIFSSNHATEKGFPFNLFLINIDGTGLKQVSYDNAFDAFPMFSPDGKKLVFSSNRNNGGDRSTNLFITDWID